MDIKMAKHKYHVHKSGAKARNIEWLFTFESWIQTWIDSGKWEQRGHKKGQYCMSRFNDVGPYSVNNVFIQPIIQNSIDGNKGKKRPPASSETKLKLSIAALGNKSNLGKKFTEEHKRKISESNKGKPSLEKGVPKPKVECPHCGKIGGGGSMKRWHFDKCKALNTKLGKIIWTQ